MNNPSRFKPEGALQIKPNGLILPQRLTERNSSTINKCQIFDLIEQHRLTDALECLETYGYTGDEALSMIRYLQFEGVAA